MSDKKRLVFSINSYAYLESKFLERGDFEHGTVERKHFPDGERYLRIAVDPRGRDVVLLGGTPTDRLDRDDQAIAAARDRRQIARRMPIIAQRPPLSMSKLSTRPRRFDRVLNPS